MYTITIKDQNGQIVDFQTSRNRDEVEAILNEVCDEGLTYELAHR